MIYHLLIASLIIPLLMIGWFGVQLAAHKGRKGCDDLFKMECLGCFFKGQCDHGHHR